MTITRINEFQAAPDKADALHTFLSKVIEVVSQAPGSLGCQLLRQYDDPAKLVIIEQWASIDAHRSAARLIPAEEIAKVMPLLASPAKGNYFLV
ncbi:putative quinol monooxygenase [Chitinimonas naiadis]